MYLNEHVSLKVVNFAFAGQNIGILILVFTFESSGSLIWQGRKFLRGDGLPQKSFVRADIE